MRRGFTLVELLVVTAILAVLSGLALGAVVKARTAAESARCRNNLRQLGLACVAYATDNGAFPFATGEFAGSATANRISGFVLLLPYINQVPLYEAIAGKPPAPSTATYKPWTTRVPVLLCPADAPPLGSGLQPANYTFGVGDSTTIDRGAFRGSTGVRFTEFDDGLSNTIALAEHVRCGSPEGDTVSGAAVASGLPAGCKNSLVTTYAAAGTRWADGAPLYGLFTTSGPPGTRPCANSRNDGSHGSLPPSSRHQGGFHGVFADGAVRFIGYDVNVGDQSVDTTSVKTGRSPYGIWGAMGTRSGGE